MVNIYDGEGNLNLTAAAAELNATRGMTNSANAQATRDILAVAATIDIAVSLRILTDAIADIAGTPVAQHPAPDGEESGGDESREADEPVDLLDADAGTPVRTIPPAGVGARYGVLTGSSGESEGEPWRGVIFNGNTSEQRVFIGRLEVVPVAERVTIDAAANADTQRQLDEAVAALNETSGASVQEEVAEAGELDTDADDAEEVDDIAADFAPLDALEALRAKRKKGGKK